MMRPANKIGGNLSMVAYAGWDDREACQPFLDEHGVSIQATYADNDSDILSALREERGSIDLVAIENRYVKIAAEADRLLPLDYARLPNSADYLGTFEVLAQDACDGRPGQRPTSGRLARWHTTRGSFQSRQSL
jgi:spermidine/putrescine-binding protein